MVKLFDPSETTNDLDALLRRAGSTLRMRRSLASNGSSAATMPSGPQTLLERVNEVLAKYTAANDD